MERRQSPTLDVDSRWVGAHGIGRFAEEIMQRVQFNGEIRYCIAPTNPFDVVALTVRQLLLPGRIVYSPGYNAPLFFLRRYVLTIHDLNHIDVPGQGFLRRFYYRFILKRACRKAACVLTVSEFSRRRISQWAGVPIDSVVNVGNGVGSVFERDGPKHVPGYDYFFCVSNRKKHKNEIRMLQGFAVAEISSSIKLEITGNATAELSELIAELGLSERVVFIGKISDPELAERYRGAIGVLLVSLYEGFGLPIIEAMACGTPVVTSNVAAMPEVAGGAAITVDPESQSEISLAIRKLVYSENDFRERLISMGLERAQEFTWDKVAASVNTQLLALR